MKAERLYFLRRMNAWQPPVPAPVVERPKRIVRDPTRPPPRAAQGPSQRYRLRYTKLGRVAFLGHLDLARHLPRIFRRAGFELAYSVGFHPKPELSFGPALGLGIPSLGEALDAQLVGEIEPAELLRRLNRVSLDGVEFLSAAALGDGDRALGRVIAEAEFAARLPIGTDVDGALAKLSGDAALSVRRESEKGIARTVDVRRSLRSMRRLDDAAIRGRLDWPDGEAVAFGIAVSQDGSARPVEVIEALFGSAIAADVELARLALYAEGGRDPLQLPELRAAASRAQARARADAAGVIAPAP